MLLFINFVYALSVEKQSTASWKENAKKLHKEYGEALEECIKEDLSEKMYQPFVTKTALLEYSLEKNIPYGVTSVFSHMLKMTEFLGLFVILVVYLGSKIYSNEYDSHTWKNLFCTEVKKRKIYLTKFIFTIGYLILYMAVFLLLSAVVGLIYFGGGSTGVVLTYLDGQIVENHILAEIFTIYGMWLIKCLFYVLLVHTCMLFTRQKMLSFLGAVVLMMIAPWVNMLRGNAKVAQFLPFYYLNMSFEGYGTRFFLYFLVLAGYSILLAVISYVKFVKSEWKYS